MSTLSSHVLDTAAGRPAVGVALTLSAWDGTVLGEATTDADGRATQVGPPVLPPGDYRLHFATGAWFATTGTTAFYPEAVVAFTVTDGAEHYHVPVLLSPYGWSTYRGS